ncbi:MAG: hypothetical protein ACR2HD_07465 [Solirubrobacteraceae bacterium]|nr:MAG: hypothetical protein DLM63_13295 [Solirubrobacterales bacterium]
MLKQLRRLRSAKVARSRLVLLAGVVIAFAVAPFAVGATGQIVRAGLSSSATTETQILGNTPTWATRQSNFNESSGGSAAYGCRAPAGTRPCVYGFNLKSGLAFEFRTRGQSAGFIDVDPTGTATSNTVAPFTTNAHAVASGLNSDMVDGKHASDFVASSSVHKLGLVKLTAGQALPLFTVGDIAVSGSCSVSGADLIAAVRFSSTAAGASYTATVPAAAVPSLAAATLANLSSTSSPPATPAFSSSRVQIVGPDGTLLSGSAFSGVAVQGAACVIGGTLTQG